MKLKEYLNYYVLKEYLIETFVSIFVFTDIYLFYNLIKKYGS